jgi:hypothetical protein
MAPILKRRPPNKGSRPKEKRTEFNFYRLSNRNGASRLVHRLRGGFALLVVVSALNAPGTASAQPDTDRSLNADKPATPAVPAIPAVPAVPPTEPVVFTNAAPVAPVDTNANASGQDAKVGAGDANPSPDLSGLTREQLEARVKTLTDSLTSANTESEYFREQWTELKLRDEALGVEALTVDESKLEDKLVQAVKELYQSEMKRREAIVLLGKLLDTTDQMIQTAPNYDPKVRADYEVASRSAKAYLGGHSGAAIPLATSLSDGRIADTNPDLNAVILNVGKTQGVKEGMPFIIYQDDVQVGTVKVVLARDLVSAAQVEELKPNTVLKIGDRAVVQGGQ